MTRTVSIPLNPITVADRLRKRAADATNENRHDDAFLMDLAASMIGELAGAKERRDAETIWREYMASTKAAGMSLFKEGVTAKDIVDSLNQDDQLPADVRATLAGAPEGFRSAFVKGWRRGKEVQAEAEKSA